jgi:hypothetical protein
LRRLCPIGHHPGLFMFRVHLTMRVSAIVNMKWRGKPRVMAEAREGSSYLNGRRRSSLYAHTDGLRTIRKTPTLPRSARQRRWTPSKSLQYITATKLDDRVSTTSHPSDGRVPYDHPAVTLFRLECLEIGELVSKIPFAETTRAVQEGCVFLARVTLPKPERAAAKGACRT